MCTGRRSTVGSGLRAYILKVRSTTSTIPLFVISGNKRPTRRLRSCSALPSTFGRSECNSQSLTKRRSSPIHSPAVCVGLASMGEQQSAKIMTCRRSRCSGVMVRSEMAIHSTLHDTSRNTTSLSFVAFERSIEPNPGSPGNGSKGSVFDADADPGWTYRRYRETRGYESTPPPKPSTTEDLVRETKSE